MIGIKSYNSNNLLSFNPDRQKGINFYVWGYKPEITIDLSLSFYHRILAPNDIHIYYKNPRIGYLYLIQTEVFYKKRVYFHSSEDIYLRFSYPLCFAGGNFEPFDINYYIFLCRPGPSENIRILDCIFGASSVYSLDLIP